MLGIGVDVGSGVDVWSGLDVGQLRVRFGT